MSENKGSMPVTFFVTREPDRSGNRVADGAADDVDIQYAIDLVGSLGGGTVVLGRGTFQITATLIDNGHNNVWLRGQGKYATKLDIQGDYHAIYLTSASGWQISDLEVDGNDHQETGTQPGVILEDCNECLLEELWVHHWSESNGYGIYIQDCTEVNAVRCRASECDHGGGIITALDGGGSWYCNFINCDGYDNADAGAPAQSAHWVIYGQDASNASNHCNILDCTGDVSGNWGAQIYRYCYNCYIKGGEYTNSETGGCSITHGSYLNTCEKIGAINVKVRQYGAFLHTGEGFSVYESHALIEGCIATDFQHGLVLNNETECVVVTGCLFEVTGDNTGTYGILAAETDGTIIHGNTFDLPYTGINISAATGDAEYNEITNNTFLGVSGYQIELGNADHTLIADNVFNGASFGDILLQATANNTQIRKNIHSHRAKITDGGVNTGFLTYIYEFVEPIGEAVWDVVPPSGIEVNAADEGAYAHGVLPYDVFEVQRIRVWAVGLAAPGATNAMEIEFNMDAGTPDEAYNAEAIAVANKDSDQVNFAVNDIVTWSLLAADDSDIGDLTFGDCFEIRVMFEVGADTDINTDALFRCVEIQYI